MSDQQIPRREAIRPGIFTGPLDDLALVRLRGRRCAGCGEAYLGDQLVCHGCGETLLDPLVFSGDGAIWSWTVLRYPPPDGYRGSVPAREPRPVAWVELPEGCVLLAPLLGAQPDRLAVGMRVRLVVYPLFTKDDGCEVLTYGFVPAQEAE